jgi:hypothetical protein
MRWNLNPASGPVSILVVLGLLLGLGEGAILVIAPLFMRASWLCVTCLRQGSF